MAFGDVVQSNENLGTTATTSPTFATAPTAGNLIILAFAADDYNGTPNSPWTQSTGTEQQTYHGGYLWWHISDGRNNYQYTIGSNSPSAWILAEIEGPFDVAPYDISNGTSNLGGSSLATPSVTPSAGDRVALATLGASSGSSLSARTATFNNSFSTIRDIGASTGGTKDFIALGIRTLTGNGSTSYNTTGTISSGGEPDSLSAIIAVFKKGAGGGGINGSASITEAADTVSFTGALAIKGSASITEAADTVSSAGKLALTGAASITEGADTLSAAGRLAIVGAASITEEDDTLSAEGESQVTGSGSAAITEADDTVSAGGVLTLRGQAAITEASDTVSATGKVAISGSASITEAGDTVSATGKLAIVGSASISEEADTLVSEGVFPPSEPILGEANIVEDDDTLLATGGKPVEPPVDQHVGGGGYRRQIVDDNELDRRERERSKAKRATERQLREAVERAYRRAHDLPANDEVLHVRNEPQAVEITAAEVRSDLRNEGLRASITSIQQALTEFEAQLADMEAAQIAEDDDLTAVLLLAA